MKKLILLSCLILGFQEALSKEDSEKETANNAVKETKSMLGSKEKRNEEMKDNAMAKENDKRIDDLVRGDEQAKEEIYSISGDVLEEIIAKEGTDPDKLNALMERAQKNPEAFYNSLSDKSKRKIQAVSKPIEKRSSVKP